MAKRDASTVTPRLRFPEFREERAWVEKALVEACERIAQGGTPDTSNPQYWDGDVAWLTPAEMGKSESPHISSTARTITEAGLAACSSELLPAGSVIMSTRAPIGHLAINAVPMAINQGCKGLIPRGDLDRMFLLVSLSNAKSRLIDLGAGNTFKELSASALKNFVIPIPHFIEQQKIADCLTSLDEVIAAQARKVEALKTHKRGLMQQLFPREGETRPRLRFPEFRDAPAWKLAFLGDVCRPQQWQTISSSELVDAGFPVYGANGFIGYYPSFNHEFETVAVTCRGSTCGEVLLIPPKSYITGNAMCLDEIDATKDSYHFLFHLLKHRGFQDVISGSAQPQIVGQAIRKLKFLLPKLSEQQRIADCLSSLDTQITAETNQLAALKAHKQGLMQQLFPAPEAISA